MYLLRFYLVGRINRKKQPLVRGFNWVVMTAILTKSTLLHIFWIAIIYCAATVVLITTFREYDFLRTPQIWTQHVGNAVAADSVKVTATSIPNSRNLSSKDDEMAPEIASQDGQLNKVMPKDDNLEETSRMPNEDQTGSLYNQSYVSVLDDQPLHYHCNDCAIVTNSGQLLGQGAGHHIDQSDCIFRMNAAPVRGFEKDVGSRADIRILGHSNIIRDDFIHNDSLIHDLFSTRIKGNPSLVLIPWLFSTELNKTGDASYLMARNLSQRFPDVKFYVSTPELVAVSEEFFQLETGVTRAQARTWLSTGWMTILFAIESCDTVNVYGMVEEQHCMQKLYSDVPYHYFASGVNDTKECQYYLQSEGNLRYGHKLITEKAVFARWGARHDLNFFYPKWEHLYAAKSSLDTLFLQLFKRNAFVERMDSRRKKMLKLIEMRRGKENKKGRKPGSRSRSGSRYKKP